MSLKHILLATLLLVLLGIPASSPAYDQEEVDKILHKKDKKYSDQKITLDVHNVPIRAVMDIIARASNKNIIVHERVQGNITLNVKDVPWDLLFDTVLRLEALYHKTEGNVIVVVPIEDATSVMGAGG